MPNPTSRVLDIAALLHSLSLELATLPASATGAAARWRRRLPAATLLDVSDRLEDSSCRLRELANARTAR